MTPPSAALRKRVLPATAALAAIGLLAGGTWYLVDTVYSKPIQRVLFAGDLRKLSRSDLDAFAQSVQGASPGGASLGAVREAARRIPWVREATVRRRFPDAVEITFETHEALARWSDGALVSERGEVFNADYDANLPRFKGPEGSAAAIAREYPAIARAVAPLPATIAELALSPRGGWQVVLDSGLVLDLGRGDIHPRLARFVAAWPQVATEARETKHADLRYANGFALKRK